MISTKISRLFLNIFGKVVIAPTNPIIGISTAYANDIDSPTINLGVCEYNEDDQKQVF